MTLAIHLYRIFGKHLSLLPSLLGWSGFGVYSVQIAASWKGARICYDIASAAWASVSAVQGIHHRCQFVPWRVEKLLLVCFHVLQRALNLHYGVGKIRFFLGVRLLHGSHFCHHAAYVVVLCAVCAKSHCGSHLLQSLGACSSHLCHLQSFLWVHALSGFLHLSHGFGIGLLLGL